MCFEFLVQCSTRSIPVEGVVRLGTWKGKGVGGGDIAHLLHSKAIVKVRSARRPVVCLGSGIFNQKHSRILAQNIWLYALPPFPNQQRFGP
jgi:hypothetical protein